MKKTIEYIVNKYQLDLDQGLPIGIPEGRDSLAELFHELKFKIGAEIGVEQGRYSKVICEANLDLKFYCIYPWTVYSEYRDTVNQEKLDGFLKKTKERLSTYNCKIIKAFSSDAVKVFEDESLDFVYLDGNHNFINMAQDIWHWERKVRKGGIVAGHDYCQAKGCDVIPVINAYVASKGISPLFIWAGDSACSWMFVK